jgi:hypothetical protein
LINNFLVVIIKDNIDIVPLGKIIVKKGERNLGLRNIKRKRKVINKIWITKRQLIKENYQKMFNGLQEINTLSVKIILCPRNKLIVKKDNLKRLKAF